MKQLIGDDWEAFKVKGKFQMKEDEDGDPMWQYNEVSCAKEVTTYIVQKDASQQLSQEEKVYIYICDTCIYI